ncbi:MAG TPA: G/U mismatch-specific DNA glycosylase [Candidatus Limnocylindria bacterium]|nr:G/U mismatch-specific DNA glycosylase [Candidatus Limnocylindria bacterium]
MRRRAPWRPTRAELAAAYGKGVPDVIAPGLRVLFAGINPGLYTAAIGHHFGRPGNRFWPALHAAGFTDRVLSPFDERELLDRGIGITNVVNKATARADELTPDEFRAGGRALVRKVRRYRPRVLAVVGVGAYRAAFGRPRAAVGPQEETIDGTRIWVLPNPSGLNANYQLAALAGAFRALREDVERERDG